MTRIGVITDSAASLPPELAEAHAIRVVPMQIIIDDAGYLEGVDISPAEVVAHLEAGRAVSTSQPSSEHFAQAIRAELDAGAGAVVIVTLSGALSGTYESASVALRETGAAGAVVDSRTVAMAQGLAAIAAARVAAQGLPLERVTAAATETAARSTCLFTVDTLDHLRRGGRVGPAVAAVGRVLGIRPVLTVADGVIAVHSRARSAARARATIAGAIAAAAAQMRGPATEVGVAVLRAGGGPAPAALDIDADLAVTGPVSAVLAAHTGPGTFAAMIAPLPAA